MTGKKAEIDIADTVTRIIDTTTNPNRNREANQGRDPGQIPNQTSKKKKANIVTINTK